MVLEYCKNGSIRTLIDETHVKFHMPTIAAMVLQVLRALAHLEFHGMIHMSVVLSRFAQEGRDVKPDNILLDESNTVKLGKLFKQFKA